MSKKEGTSIALAFAGFAVLVLTFKGTWGRAYGALLGHKSAGSSAGTGSTSSTSGVMAQSGQLAIPFSAGTLAFAGVTAGRPAQGPVPAAHAPAVHTSSFVPHPITIGTTHVMGQLTEGGKGETEYFTSRDQGVGGLPDWRGAGHYTRVKTQAPDGSGQNTIWIYKGP